MCARVSVHKRCKGEVCICVVGVQHENSLAVGGSVPSYFSKMVSKHRRFKIWEKREGELFPPVVGVVV